MIECRTLGSSWLGSWLPNYPSMLLWAVLSQFFHFNNSTYLLDLLWRLNEIIQCLAASKRSINVSWYFTLKVEVKVILYDCIKFPKIAFESKDASSRGNNLSKGPEEESFQRKMTSYIGLYSVVCNDHENEQGWWWLEVWIKKWVSDLGRLRNQILVQKGFPKRSACSLEGMQIILDSLFIFTVTYMKKLNVPIYFLHIFLFIPIYFLSLVGFLSQMISCHISSWGYSEGRVRIDFLSLWGTQTAILI